MQGKAPKAQLLGLIQSARKKYKDAVKCYCRFPQNSKPSVRLAHSKLVRCVFLYHMHRFLWFSYWKWHGFSRAAAIFQKMEQFCKQNHFSRQQLQPITPHKFLCAFDTQFWGLGRCFGSNLGTTAARHWLCQGSSERKRVLSQGIAGVAWIWSPPCRKVCFHYKHLSKTIISMHIQVWA